MPTQEPIRLDQVSVTEMQQFDTCRRQWYLSSVKKLVPREPQKALWFGIGIHEALEAYFGARSGPLPRALTALDNYYRKTTKEFARGYSPQMWGMVEDDFHQTYLLGKEMLTGYHRFHHRITAPSPWKVIAVEQRVWVPISTPRGQQVLRGAPRLTARMDLMVQTGDGELGIIDHKTATQKPSTGTVLDLDEQLTGYAYVYWKLTGEVVRFVTYDVLMKKAPEPPRELQSGELSKDRAQPTTLELYLKAIKARKESPNDPKYREILSALTAKGDSDYFMRVSTSRNEQQLRSYGQRLYHRFSQMRAVARDERLAYAQPSQMKCPSCSFLEVCLAKEAGYDAESMIDQQFTASTEERW
jgi:RecB family exonuclease